MSRFVHLVPVLAGAMLISACELQEITLAPPDDVVVVEAYLRTDRPQQLALLHRTLHGDQATAVLGASLTVTGPGGEVHAFGLTTVDACIDSPQRDGTCYVAGDATAPFYPVPGARYNLVVELPDGRRIEGSTVVPGSFDMHEPAAAPCTLRPGELLDVVWSPSDGAWVYLVDAELSGLQAALAAKGIEIDEDPFRLTGVSISREDTTITFPTELGVFDRFDLPREVLLELQKGLPDGVRARITVGAADRNFVNWARRGNFNPSGLVRVSSMRGDGIGVFGSLVAREFVVGSSTDPWPPCT